MNELDLGEPKVSEICDEIGASDELKDAATEQARRVDRKFPINHTGRVVAASSVYFQGLMCKEKVIQEDVADAAGTCTVSLRECYPKIAEAEGIELTEHSQKEADTESEDSDTTRKSGIISALKSALNS